MTPVEKVFFEIFDRAKWIVDQVKQQSDSFDQYLLTLCLIKRIPPPSWILSAPSFHATHFQDLKKEDLISGLLFPPPRAPGRNNLYNTPFFTNNSDALFTTGAASVRSSKRQAKESNVCGVRELDPVITSPPFQTEANTVDTDIELDESLVKIQRSRSRQKAFHLRNSASLKSEKQPSGPKHTTAFSGRITRSRSSSKQSDSNATNGGSCRVTRSRSGSHQLNSVDKPMQSSNAGNKEITFCSALDNRGAFNLKGVNTEEQLRKINSTDECCSINEMSQAAQIDSAKGLSEPDKYEKLRSGRGTHSRSSSSKKISESDARPIVVKGHDLLKAPGSRLIELLGNDGTDIVHQERCIAGDADIGFASSLPVEACSSPPTDENIIVEPKQLFFDEVENCIMDGSITLQSEKENGRGSPGNARSPTPTEALGEVIFSHGLLEKHSAQFLEKNQSFELISPEGTLGLSSDALADIILPGLDMDQNKVGLGETCSQKLDVVASKVLRNASEGTESQSFSDKRCRQANIVSNTSSFASLVQQNRQPDALVTDNEPVSCQSVEACSSRLGSDVGGSSSGVVEFLFPSPLRNDNNFVEPKQLLFDEVQDCNVSGSLTFQSEKEKRSGSPGSRSPRPAESQSVTHVSFCKKHVLLLEHQETEHFDAADAANRNILTKIITPKFAETNGTGRNVPYMLRSYTKHDNNDGFFKSEEPSFQRKSKRSKKNTDNASENSWPLCKRRKIDRRSSTAFTTSSRLVRVEPLHQIDKNGISRFHENAEYGSKTDLEFNHITLSSDVKTSHSNAVKRPFTRLSRSAKHCKTETCDTSLKTQDKKGEHDAEGGEKDTNTCLRFEKTGAVASLVSDLGKEICENAEDCLSGSTDMNITQSESDEYRYLLLPEIELDIQKIKQLGSIERVFQDTGSTDLNVTHLPTDDHRHPMFPETALDIEKMDHLGSAEGGLQKRESVTREQLLSYCSVRSPSLEDVNLIAGNQSMPEFEGFNIGLPSKQILSLPGERISLGNIDLPTTTSERISVIEKMCKSVGMLTPLTWSSKHKIHRTPDVYQSLPDGLLECMDLKRTVPFSDGDCLHLNASYNLVGEESELASYSDRMPLSSVQLDWGVPHPPFTPPVRMLNQRNTSVPAGRSFEKLQIINPELTCFRIDENTSTSEENENLDEALHVLNEKTSPRDSTSSSNRRPLVDKTNRKKFLSISVTKNHNDRGSIESVNMGSNMCGMQFGAKQMLRSVYGEERRAKKDKENQNSSIGGKGVSKVSDCLYSERPNLMRKVSEGKESQSFVGKGCRRGNIVSNMSSFIPLVQQKRPPAALVTGKRDVKVKALEAAEAAKKLEEKRENDRKMKKEAAKLERARLEQEKIKQLELKNKKNEEERKKKEADMAARKRTREEDDIKEKERKRKCTEEARRLRDKLHAEKEEKVQRCRAADGKNGKKKDLQNKEQKHEKTEKGSKIADCRQKMETDTRNAKVPVGNAEKASDVRKDSMGVKGDHDKVLDSICEPNNCGFSFTKESGEKSYEISPYQASDDEDEEGDEDEQDLPNKKFIPSWAREKHIASILPSMHRVDPCEIFLRTSFCSISEAIMSRRNLK